ncbi:MAG: hypothetical protein MK218_00370 [Gammaproteobacteria bacterium]|nr:hypothetical protein [Gammaproteobacteria bacterium]
MKLKKLDLHGIKHRDVDIKVENFILLNQEQIPLEIVCGNSQRMIDLVTSTLDRIECEDFDQVQFGTIIVRKL